MNENEELPIPDKSGSSGSQKSSGDMLAFQEEKPLEGLHMAKTIDGLATTHARSLGGEVTSALIAGSTRQMAADYQEIKFEFKKLSEKFDLQRNELEETRTRRAVLIERIRSEGRNKHLRNLSITIGTSLIGTGIFLSRSELDIYTFGSFGFGLVLLFLGWISGPKEVEE